MKTKEEQLSRAQSAINSAQKFLRKEFKKINNKYKKEAAKLLKTNKEK